MFQGAEAQLRVGLVVPAQDRGAGPGPPDVPRAWDRGGGVFGSRRPATPRRLGRARQARVASVTTASVPSEPTRSLLRSGPAAERGHRAQAQDLAVRQDRGQPEQHVLDRAEPGGGLPGRRRGDPAADGGDRDRLRVVARWSGRFVASSLLEAVAAHPGLDLDRLGFRVDEADAVHPGQVEDDGAGFPPAPRRRRRSPRPSGRPRCPSGWPRPGRWRPPRCGPGRRTAAGSGRSSPRTRRSSASDQESIALGAGSAGRC